MDDAVLQQRTKIFGLGIIRLVEGLPESLTASTIGGQLLRSGNLVGAKYRAASKAHSPREKFVHLDAAHEKADESLYLMEMLVEAKLIDEARVAPLIKEATALVNILSQAVIEQRGLLGPEK